LPKGLAFFAGRALPPSVFKDRYSFDDPDLRRSPISMYLAYKNNAQRAA
jgi:hypothetical protein